MPSRPHVFRICGLLILSLALMGAPIHSAVAQQPKTPATAQSDAELLFWQSIMNSQSKADYEAYLQTYPNGKFAALAKARAASLSAGGGSANASPGTGGAAHGVDDLAGNWSSREPAGPATSITTYALSTSAGAITLRAIGVRLENPLPGQTSFLQASSTFQLSLSGRELSGSYVIGSYSFTNYGTVNTVPEMRVATHGQVSADWQSIVLQFDKPTLTGPPYYWDSGNVTPKVIQLIRTP